MQNKTCNELFNRSISEFSVELGVLKKVLNVNVPVSEKCLLLQCRLQ